MLQLGGADGTRSDGDPIRASQRKGKVQDESLCDWLKLEDPT